MKRLFFSLQMLMACLTLFPLNGNSQTNVEVKSALDHSVLPFVQLKITDVKSAYIKLVVTDEHGKFVLSDAGLTDKRRIIIEASLLGFDAAIDTVSYGSDLIVFLHEKVLDLDEIVVTAQYGPASPENSMHRVRVVDAKRIQQMAAVNLRDVLTNELNIRLSQDNILGSGLSMQGISGENVKILIDGIPVIGRLNGNIDLSQINMYNVERIEIVEGPLNVNFGSNALAGTINIITKKQPKEKWRLIAESYNENTGTFNQSVSVSNRIGQHYVTLCGLRNFFDGWNPSDFVFPHFRRTPADSSRYKSWKPKEQISGCFQYGFTNKRLNIDFATEYFKEVITNRGLPLKPYGERAMDDYYQTRRVDHSIHSVWNITPQYLFNFLASVNQYHRIKSTWVKDLTTLNETLSSDPGSQDTAQFTQYMSRASFVRNADNKRLTFESGYDFNFEQGNGSKIDGDQKSIGDFAVFLTAQIETFKNLYVRPGLRYSYNTSYNAPLVPSVNIKYPVPLDTKGRITLRASYARGFRAPSMKELYLNFVDINHNVFGNEDLKAEFSDNITTGMVYNRIYRLALFQTEFGFFINQVENLISLAQSSEPGLFRYINIGLNKTRGATISQSVGFRGIKVNASANYTGRNNDFSELAGGKDFLWYPEFRGSVSWDIKKLAASLSFFYKYNGKMPGFMVNDLNELVAITSDSFQIADGIATKAFFKSTIMVSAGIKNIFNVTSVRAFNSETAHGGNDVGLSPMAMGRMAILKIGVNLNRL